MTLAEAVMIYEQAAAGGIQIRGGLPALDQWERVRTEYDALPSGARWQMELMGASVVLVNGPLASVPGCEGIPPVVAGIYLRQGCLVSLPVAYPAGTTNSSRTVLHEPGHAMDWNRENPEWPYSRQGDWQAIHAAHGWPDSAVESWAEQFGWWCLWERYGGEIANDVLLYFRGKARSRGWYQGNNLYWPR